MFNDSHYKKLISIAESELMKKDLKTQFEIYGQYVADKDLKNKKAEEITVPDTFKCKTFFAYMLAAHMDSDSPVVTRDFLIEENNNINEYGDKKYVKNKVSQVNPALMLPWMIINHIMNAADNGSKFAKELIVKLYKTYYNREYRQIKRFNKISRKDLLTLASNGSELDFFVLMNILSISPMLDIEIDADCYFFYSIINQYIDADSVKDKIFKIDTRYANKIADIYLECVEEIRNTFDNEDEMRTLYNNAQNYVMNVAKAEGNYEKYIEQIDTETKEDIISLLGHTLAVLKTTYKDKLFEKNEIILYSVIYSTVKAVFSVSAIMQFYLEGIIFGEKSSFYQDVRLGYHSDILSKKTAKASNENSDRNNDSRSRKTNSSDSHVSMYKEEILVSQIQDLYSRIHLMESEIEDLRGQLVDKRLVSEENKRLREETDTYRKELAALRNHLYSMTEQDIHDESASLADMKEYLNTLRIIVVGGHSNWLSKLKQEFKDWIYIDPTVSGTLDASVVEKADCVYFFTDVLSHSTYYKYISIARESNVNIGYIHGVNIESNISQLYHEMKRIVPH